MKTCIACAEQIMPAALLCRFCGTEQNDSRFLPSQVPSSGSSMSESSILGSNVDIDGEASERPAEQQLQGEGDGKAENFLTEVPKSRSSFKIDRFGWVGGGAVLIFIAILLGSSGIAFSGSYPANEEGLNRAASDCASQVIKANQNSVQSSDPYIQDSLIEQVARCIITKNPSYKCSFGPDPVCVWLPEMVEGPRVMYMSSVYEKFRNAGSPYFQKSSSGSSTNNQSGSSTNNQSGSSTNNQSGSSTNHQSSISRDDSPTSEAAYSEPPPPKPVIWVPTKENIRLCSIDYNLETCPNDTSNYVVEDVNTFGLSAEVLKNKMLQAGFCEQWPAENKVWEKPDVDNACLSDHDGFYIATGDEFIWNLIYIHPYGETYAAGDGWVVYSVYESLEIMEKVANLLGGEAWQRGY